MATASLDRPGAKTGYKVIDADTHLTEPHDMWTSRAPASIRDRVPQVKMLDGQEDLSEYDLGLGDREEFVLLDY